MLQVLSAYLCKAYGELALDPLASACLPALSLAIQPMLQHIHPASALLQKNIAIAAAQIEQLQDTMRSASQVQDNSMANQHICITHIASAVSSKQRLFLWSMHSIWNIVIGKQCSHVQCMFPISTAVTSKQWSKALHMLVFNATDLYVEAL